MITDVTHYPPPDGTGRDHLSRLDECDSHGTNCHRRPEIAAIRSLGTSSQDEHENPESKVVLVPIDANFAAEAGLPAKQHNTLQDHTNTSHKATSHIHYSLTLLLYSNTILLLL